MVNRRQFLYTAASVVAGVAVTGLYTRFGEPYWTDVVHRTMPVSNLPSALEGKTLVQLSDLHLREDIADEGIGDDGANVQV